jgi:hypothetical protein
MALEWPTKQTMLQMLRWFSGMYHSFSYHHGRCLQEEHAYRFSTAQRLRRFLKRWWAGAILSAQQTRDQMHTAMLRHHRALLKKSWDAWRAMADLGQARLQALLQVFIMLVDMESRALLHKCLSSWRQHRTQRQTAAPQVGGLAGLLGTLAVRHLPAFP